MLTPFQCRPLPAGLEGLGELAQDLRWMGSEIPDRVWEMLDPVAWECTHNPYLILQNATDAQLMEAAKNPQILQELKRALNQRYELMEKPCWFDTHPSRDKLGAVAYFSMEFGLSEALPIYSGGLGILAGDHLKTASDMRIPLVGIGLLYQQGYFRQSLSMDRAQMEAYPYNDPVSLPVVPVRDPEGGWLRVHLDMPGRTLRLRVWSAQIGTVVLYLLDSNDPLNSPWDRGVTATLYAGGAERRLMQEIVLGFGGWQALEELGIEPDVCHLNEGHAAFVVLARARSFMRRHNVPFEQALWATRAGNVFTTHTPVAAGFDRFDGALLRKYAQHFAETVGLTIDDLMLLGSEVPGVVGDALNMACLATWGSAKVNAVSALHGRVSREIFAGLYPGRPVAEVPVGHVTNGVHIPTWDSDRAHALWARACGHERWHDAEQPERMCAAVVPDEELWQFRCASRRDLVEYVRRRMKRQIVEEGGAPDRLPFIDRMLDPDALTLGFARRFATYKRPNLILHDEERLVRLLRSQDRPVQLIVAGKAHPDDAEGKRMVQRIAQFALRWDVCDRVAFLSDYDMALTQALAAGVDVWLNTPRRPWEASGTSGMKLLVNGGLNLSELDGWWAEAYTPEVGWALGDGREHPEPEWDAFEAGQLYDRLENEVVPEFYDRDDEHLPRRWIERVRASMCQLTARFSSNRMVKEYVENAYIPASEAYRKRVADDARLAAELADWHRRIAKGWPAVRFGQVRAGRVSEAWRFEVEAFLDDLKPEWVQVQMYAEDADGNPSVWTMKRKRDLPGSTCGGIYVGDVPADRPIEHYTARIVPYHPDAFVPTEERHILWQK